MFFRKKKEENAKPIWEPVQGGFEATRSRQLIENALASLEKNRTALVMVQKGTPSSPTILLGCSAKYLLIDAPVDWKLKNLSVRIQFKDDAHLDSYFDSKIVYVKDEIIYAKLPVHLHRLQRRAHYRVEVPGGSQVAFAAERSEGDFIVRNVSAGGMLCCSKNLQLARGMVLRDIDLRLTLAAGKPAKSNRITIPQGRIVRTFDDRASGQFCYGVAFDCGVREESSLLTYIRHRELELAKAGVSA